MSTENSFREVGAGKNFLSPTDFIIEVDTSVGAVEVVLPKIATILNTNPSVYQYIGIRFVDISNNASVNNITITGFETDTINGATNIVLNTNGVGGVVSLIGNDQWAYLQNLTSVPSTPSIVSAGAGLNSTQRIDSLNSASGSYATAFGFCNTSSGVKSTISGGSGNVINNCCNTLCSNPNFIVFNENAGTISGGKSNQIIHCISSAITSVGCALGGNTIGGGCNNIAGQTLSANYQLAGYTTIGGGISNTASCYLATIGGGKKNIASGSGSTIGGGECNIACKNSSTISGGYKNISSNNGSTVGGGCRNTASCTFTTIGGGEFNVSSGNTSTIAGGETNTASGYFSVVAGGFINTASGYYSTISGGYKNSASGQYSFAGGGRQNVASSIASAILGGRSNNTSTFACAMIVGSNITADRVCTTFVNNLSIKTIPTSSAGLPSGSVWRNGTVLEIVV
jgi:hypothetical protein